MFGKRLTMRNFPPGIMSDHNPSLKSAGVTCEGDIAQDIVAITQGLNIASFLYEKIQ